MEPLVKVSPGRGRVGYRDQPQQGVEGRQEELGHKYQQTCSGEQRSFQSWSLTTLLLPLSLCIWVQLRKKGLHCRMGRGRAMGRAHSTGRRQRDRNSSRERD